MDEQSTGSAVTLEAFAERVGCHFTTASRLKAGHRLPGRRLLGRIIKGYDLDPSEALEAFTSDKETFGEYLRSNVFLPPKKADEATDTTDAEEGTNSDEREGTEHEVEPLY